MINILSKRRKIALVMLAIWCSYQFAPSLCYALTSGPAQPETKGFQAAGVADMVDLQSGDLKYNVPLIDIDGYPINLSYQSGVGIDDEASWVGLGWSLNPGAINRQVRGLPDDFSGDTVETDHYVKPKVTVGGRLTAKVEFKGIANLGGSFSFGVFSDNYTGIGAELGVNAGISYSIANDGLLTAGLGVGILSNTQSGVDASISPYVSLSVRENAVNNTMVNAGLSGSFGYNSRSGIKALTLGASFGGSYDEKEGKTTKSSADYSVLGSTISYNTEPISPSIQIPYTSTYGSFSFDVGGEAFALFGSVGGTGYQNIRSVTNIINQKPAFGFLYAERGKDNQDAVMDFIREKDNPIIPEIPNIALPIHTPDLWTYTSQAGSGQFRLYRGGSGIFFDNNAEDASAVSTSGGDLGVGAWVHVGLTHYSQNAKTTTRKWTNANSYLANGDFQKPSYTNPGAEHAYFRQIGEKNTEDQDMDTRLAGSQALEVDVPGMAANSALRNAGNLSGTAAITVNSPIAKTTRRPNRTMISYLTAAEATQAGLSETIPDYYFKDSTSYSSLTATQTPDSVFVRVDPSGNSSTYIHKPHHISEVTVTDDGGKKMVYGIPVYNISQDEYSFAIDPTTRDANNLVSVPSGITSPSGDPNGIDNYYHKEHKPAYATSFLLTAILSPDYVDKTGDGVTDDDLGTAIKFNYSKLPYYYKWRTPYSKATPNRGLMADPDDDKGSIVYGKKEIWYVQSIESKTKIAYFITQNRRDAVGAAGWQNGNRDTTNKQKCLTEIRLYSKADMTKPIKVVKFQYTYSLCRGIPNSCDSGSANPSLGGKLTLARVWFEYGNSDKGKYHPYIFQYNQSTSKYNGAGTPVYAYNSTDRWGVYKPSTENLKMIGNEQYPYTNQDSSYTNQNSALWHLNKIILPTGGTINVTYESGDYAYVQNQKAMAMTPITSLIVNTSSTTDTTRALNSAINGLRLNIGTDTIPPAGVNQTTWFENTFLDGSNYIYTKLCVNMTTANYTVTNPLPYDFVPTYCLVSSVNISGGVANVMLTPITADNVTANPMCISAWQRLKNEYPRYAYPGFQNRIQTNNNSILAAVSAIVNAAKNLTELKEGLYQKANSRGYASKIVLSQSFVKIAKTKGFKLGGPTRVKKIQISDNWNTASNPTATSSSYGQYYTYTTTENGKTISSGVATYEPAIGNDENALKQPVPYIENIKGAINNFFDLELPFGESLYPAPSVGYSKVTVNDLDQNGNLSTKTGAIINEFYTAKDYPVVVKALPLISNSYKPASHYSLVYSNSDDELSLSQGYSIQLNDMNGKPKATTVLDQTNAVISATAYYYNSQTNGGVMSLNNNVNVINPTTLQLSGKVLGQDVDFFTDFREQETSNKGQAINVGGDVFPIPPFLPFFGLPHFPININNDYKLFRSACAVKVIQSYGILTKVVKTENGSTITTQNLAYDGVTGEALVTRTNNEFNQSIYSVNIPAYWVYQGMGAAYQNLGVLLSGFKTNANGEITISYSSYLQGGDEIVDTNTGNHYWVINNQAASGEGNSNKLIDRNGVLIANYNPAALVKIVKSGFHNMLNASTTTLVSLSSPFTADNHLQLISSADLTSMKVINASATTYDQNWGDSKLCNNLVVNQSRVFTFRPGDVSTTYCDSGATITPSVGVAPKTNKALVWQNSLSRSSLWINQNSSLNLFEWMGFESCVNIPVTGTYFFGFGADNGIKTYIDGAFADSTQLYSNTSYTFWHVTPHYLTAGNHIILVEFLNRAGPATAGLEIYNNTASTLTNSNVQLDSLNIIFTSASLVNVENVQSFRTVNNNMVFHYTVGGVPMPVCLPNFVQVINPYIQGYLGNWRSYQTKVFQQSRNYTFAGNMTRPGIDVKNAGYMNNFYSYWWYNNTSAVWSVNPNGTRWVTANTVTLYDRYGQQLENKDALGRYSAAKFDFNGELPAAVASNAMNREIYANSLEDCKFIPGDASNMDTCNNREFVEPSTGFKIKQLAVSSISHSGNYSALLPSDGLLMATVIDTLQQKNTPFYVLDNLKQYNNQSITGLYPNGFEPYPGKKYIFNAWINDSYVNDKSVNLTLSINGNNVPLTCKAIVEGWKLVEGTMDLSTITGGFLDISIVPNSNTTIYIDDIRMHPFDAQMKTYAYDDKTLRLVAEIDENGFATFYEYDDEGLLVRVKKETEKGIMTLKESRSTYRRNTQ